MCRPVGSENPQLMNGHTQLRMAELGLGTGCPQPQKQAAVEVSRDRNGCKVGSFQCFGFFSTFFLHFERERKALHCSGTVMGADWFSSLKSVRA